MSAFTHDLSPEKEAMLERVQDLELRRLNAFSESSGKGLSTKEHLAMIPESTTVEDIQMLHEARAMLDPFAMAVLDLYSEVWREWGKYRCSVCGRTAKQNAAIGYDCAREC